MIHVISRRDVLVGAAAFGATLGVPSLASAQAFPDKSKPIKAIVAFAVSSTADTVGRAYAQAMSETLGANVVVENRPGAEGVLGMQAVRSAAPDGYTMLFTSLSTQVINPHLFKQLPYDPQKDYIPLAGTMKSALLMNVGTSIKANSVREFVELAKANPGKYTFASVSATTRLSGEMFAKAAGIKLVNVPYKNFTDLTTDLIRGRVDLLFADLPAVQPFYSQGIRTLGVLATQRATTLPDIPTLQEQGVAGVEVVGWHGAYVTANTPPAVVAVLRDAVRQAAGSKPVKDYLSNFKLEPLPLVGEDFAAFQRAEFEKWGRAIRESGMAGML